MKRFLLFTLLSFYILSAKAQIKWDGSAGDNQWNTASNWVGDIIPVAGDNVLLDNSVVGGNYTVFLPGGALAISLNSLIITPSGSNSITLTLPVTNTNNPGLNITGTGDALVLNNGGILKNSSGASSGTGISIVNTFRINNGGHYIHNTGRGNATIVSQLSTVAGTELGEFEFDDPTGSSIISLSNRTYGSLTLSALSNGTASYIGSGANPLNINGDLKIKTGVTFAISMSANFILHRNYDQAALSTFNLQSSTNNNIVRIKGNVTGQGIITESNTGLPTLELNGTTNQNLNITGSITNSVTLNMNNIVGATLLSPLTLPYNLQLTNGKIKTTSVFLLTMIDNATYAGGSSTSFVEGPMKKVGNDNFVFPIGIGSIYAQIGLVNVSGELAGDEFIAEYKRTNPQGIHTSAVQGGLNHVSYVEYWKLDQNIGTSSKLVSLKVNTTSFCKVLANTFVSKWNGSLWTNEGSTISGFASIPPFETGTITSTSTISNFGDFTLTTDLNFSANPLPIKLISFDAIKINSTAALLKWELAACCSDAARFEVEKSTDKKNFISVDKVSGSLINRFYTLPDSRLNRGITYYRLKMTDDDGAITYSRIIAIINNEAGLLITSIWPNPIQNNATVTLTAAKAGKIRFTICDFSGKIVKQWYADNTEGTNYLPVNADGLASGIYHIIADVKNSKVVLCFIKK
jgi:hypothetical protein